MIGAVATIVFVSIVAFNLLIAVLGMIGSQKKKK